MDSTTFSKLGSGRSVKDVMDPQKKNCPINLWGNQSYQNSSVRLYYSLEPGKNVELSGDTLTVC